MNAMQHYILNRIVKAQLALEKKCEDLDIEMAAYLAGAQMLMEATDNDLLQAGAYAKHYADLVWN